MSSARAFHNLGVTAVADGVRVAVYSAHAEALFFCLPNQPQRGGIALERQGDWHVGFIPDVTAGEAYGLRATGPYAPEAGQHFDPAKLLLDPYAREISAPFFWHEDLARCGVETAGLVPHGIVTAPLPKAKTFQAHKPQFIYEIAVRAFSKLHPQVPEAQRGTVAALAHPAVIEHLLKLGVDTIELMPITAWVDERHLARQGLRNAWGYNPISYFAPDPRLAPGGMAEIQRTVAALHDAGLNVLLDVVYNHSGESDVGGPTLSFRGLDSLSYYRHHHGALVNDTGCGNTLATDHPALMDLVLDSLRYWHEVGGFDGFRYDLGTVLGRRDDGFDRQAPLLQAIQNDAALGKLIHIAEPWDIGPGGYQLGHFPVGWGEWNDRARDDMRRFWRGDHGALGPFITRLAGSSDIFNARGRRPSASINFISAHDGFTLHDVVHYDQKHNFANGENNRDGNGHEPCWIAQKPQADARALLASLFFARGTIMLTAGDEFGRSQQGNNNAYAQDNELTWLDWRQADLVLQADVAELARLRCANAAYFADGFLTGQAVDARGLPDVLWFNRHGTAIDWQQPDEQAFGMALTVAGLDARLLVFFNRGADVIEFTPPAPQQDFCWAGEKLVCEGRSVVVQQERLQASAAITPADDAVIEQLAQAAGVQLDWYEVDGTHHHVPQATLRHILAALALPAGSQAEVRVAMRQIAEQRHIPATHLAQPNQPFIVTVEHATRRGVWHLEGDHPAFGLQMLGAVDGHCAVPPLPPGIYKLRPEAHSATPKTLIVSDGQCYVPDALRDGRKLFGLSTHLYALRDKSDSGIGDFETLARCAEATAQCHGALVGINPLHCMFTDDRGRASPYQPSDRRFIDPIYIDVRGAAQQFGHGFTPAEEQQAALLRALSHVDYAAVWQFKDGILQRLFAHAGETAAFLAFVQAGGAALAEHAAYEARHDASRGRYAMWLQWLADTQLGAAAARAAQAGVPLGLYRDLALGCAVNGGEVWARPELYATSLSLGAPPDPFSRSGQIWGLPPFNPLKLAEAGFQPFIDIMRANMRHARVLRIDHVLGLYRQFWVPDGATGSDGAYMRMPFEALLAITALESQRARCLIVGEDLGTVAEGFRERMSEANIMSYRVLWFEQTPQGFVAPQNYPAWSAACLSSHDLPPLQQWQEMATADEKTRLQNSVAMAGHATGDVVADAHGFLAASASQLMLVQADDLSGETEPLNVPGTDVERPNWRRRMACPVEDLPHLPVTRRILPRILKNGRGIA